ncbi:DUF4253 domain-containing protein [Subtercola boreus]|uniref:DUF4253 domain-containing protein n=1 Tax=Subtercola boreus TaxID=120213 RepID=A0A3E0WAK2_9MICO|nr:DUF4253 domain-containing protein [Subtercola boreus]RFA21036.1 hypothetical protein B7R24_06405 [Subtercola boreus]RFA21420.1 hypothetical protein B7R23_06350 [Subtercola boreus]RFA27391.1 hypothetical protein B7R25_06475 [Subtercola boreus]
MLENDYQPPPLTFAEPGSSWGELAARFPTTNLWPIFGAGHCYRDRPGVRHTHWRDDPPTPATTLREQFGLDRRDEYDIQEDDFCFECGVVRDRSGELSIGNPSGDGDFLRALDRWRDEEERPALIAAENAWDCLAELGWTGAVNSGMLGADASVVLESWQRRFGAYVFSAYGASLELVVARPPTTVEDARLLAREHFHFCRYDSQFHGTGGIGPYVRQLVGSHSWSFWWD